MYMYVRGIDFASVSAIFNGIFGNVRTVWGFCVFHFITCTLLLDLMYKLMSTAQCCRCQLVHVTTKEFLVNTHLYTV
jgi:hypothetical protein